MQPAVNIKEHRHFLSSSCQNAAEYICQIVQQNWIS